MTLADSNHFGINGRGAAHGRMGVDSEVKSKFLIEEERGVQDSKGKVNNKDDRRRDCPATPRYPLR